MVTETSSLVGYCSISVRMIEITFCTWTRDSVSHIACWVVLVKRQVNFFQVMCSARLSLLIFCLVLGWHLHIVTLPSIPCSYSPSGMLQYIQGGISYCRKHYPIGRMFYLMFKKGGKHFNEFLVCGTNSNVMGLQRSTFNINISVNQLATRLHPVWRPSSYRHGYHCYRHRSQNIMAPCIAFHLRLIMI